MRIKILQSLFFTVLFAFTQIGMAQSPQGVNYQAVARDGSGNIMANQSLTVRMTIKEGGPAGTTVYQETHNTSTNDFGLFDLVVGQGSVASGTFSNINWGNNSHFLQVEVDDGSGYVNLGTSQFVSVPYALYAKEAGNSGTSYSAGTGISISGNTITNTGDTNPSDDITNSSNAGGDVSGNFNNLTVVRIQGRNVSNAAPGNGQVLKWNGSAWAPANDVGGGSGDNWGTQTVESDNTLTGNGVSGSPLSVDGDLTDNQTLSVSGSNLTISNGNTVSLPTSSGDITAVKAGTGLSGGGTSGNVTINANTNSAIWNADALQGNAVSTTSPSNGQVLKWNGSAWAPAADNSGSGGTSPWNELGNDINYTNGDVFIGRTSSISGEEVFGITGQASANGYAGMYIEGSDQESWPFYGYATNGTSDMWTYYDGGNGNWTVYNKADRLTVQDDGNVGIGTTNPSEKLHVEGGKVAVGNASGTMAKLTVNATGTNEEVFRARRNGATQFIVDQDGNVGVHTGLPDNAFSVEGDANFTDNVGIGTTSPDERLSVSLSSGSDAAFIEAKSTNSNGYAGMVIDRAEQTDNGYVIFRTAGSTKWYVGQMTNDANFSISRTVGGDNTIAINESTGQIGFGTSSFNEDVRITDIDNNGEARLSIGSGTDDGIDIGSEYLEDGGPFTLQTNSHFVSANDDLNDLGTATDAWQDVYTNNGVTVTSDRRSKKNIQPMKYGLEDILALNPVSYKLKNDREADKPKLGLVAQDVEQVIGEVVKTHDWVRTADGNMKLVELERYGINYSELVPVLIKSIQEQQSQIDQLKGQNQQLQGEMDALRKRVEKLEK